LPPCSLGPLLPNGVKFCHEILETLSYHMVKPVVSTSTGLETIPGRDGQTGGWTELP